MIIPREMCIRDRVYDAAVGHHAVFVKLGVVAVAGLLGALYVLNNHAAVYAGIDGNLTHGLFKSAEHDVHAGLVVLSLIHI